MTQEREARTTGLAARGHPEVVVRYDADKVLERDVAWLTGHVEDLVAEGGRFAAGDVIQVGWTPLRFAERPGGELALEEPELAGTGEGLHFVDSVHAALLHLRLQRSAADSVGLASALEFPSLRDCALRCDAARGAGVLYLARSEPADGDSGWFVGCADAGHDHESGLEGVSLLTLAREQPEVVPFLAFPPGVAVLLDREGRRLLVRRGAERLEVEPESYLALRFPEPWPE